MNKYHKVSVFMCDWCGGLYHLEALAANCQHGHTYSSGDILKVPSSQFQKEESE